LHKGGNCGFSFFFPKQHISDYRRISEQEKSNVKASLVKGNRLRFRPVLNQMPVASETRLRAHRSALAAEAAGGIAVPAVTEYYSTS